MFGGRALPGPAGRAHSAPPDLLAAFREGQGKRTGQRGREDGKGKGDKGREQGGGKKEKGKGKKERRRVVPHQKLNPGCATGHFTLNFHYYQLAFWEYYLLIYCRVCLHPRDQRRCGKRSSGPSSAEYMESAEKLRMFELFRNATLSES